MGSSTGAVSADDHRIVTENTITPPPFQTPPKLQPGDEKQYPGTDLRTLTTALAKDAIFGQEDLLKCSLSGRNNTEKLNYIKVLVESRVPSKSQVEFEHIWTLCRIENLPESAEKEALVTP